MNQKDATQEYIVKRILDERMRQDEKWGEARTLSHLMWNAILGEEVGEATKAVVEGSPELVNELIQSAAVIFAWLEQIDRHEGLV